MTFAVTLEHFMAQTISFVTVEDCKDMSDCIDQIHAEFPGWNIEQIKEVI